MIYPYPGSERNSPSQYAAPGSAELLFASRCPSAFARPRSSASASATCGNTWIYKYTDRQRERERERYIYIYTHMYIYIYMCMYIYIYIHTYACSFLCLQMLLCPNQISGVRTGYTPSSAAAFQNSSPTSTRQHLQNGSRHGIQSKKPNHKVGVLEMLTCGRVKSAKCSTSGTAELHGPFSLNEPL